MTLTAKLQFYVGQYVQSVHAGSAHRASYSLGIGVKTAEGGVELHLYSSMCFPGVHRDFTCTYAPVTFRLLETSEPNTLHALKTHKMAVIINKLLSVAVHELTKIGHELCTVTNPEERPLPWFPYVYCHECEDTVNVLP